MNQQKHDLERQEFNAKVFEHLEREGRPGVAQMARDYARDMGALGPSAVAREEGLSRSPENVEEVAQAHVDWYNDTNQGDRDA